MRISEIIQTISTALDSVRNAILPIPAILLSCTCSRRPGFSSILTSAKVYADMNQNENDEIVKKFVFNVIDKIKKNMQDDGICFVIIPPNELMIQAIGANGGGPIILEGTNKNYIFTYAIIR